MDKNKGRGKRLTKHFITVLWLFSMGLAGFFAPYFTDNIPFLKVKKLYLEGLETIPPQVVVEEVKRFRNNGLLISEGILLDALNQRLGNAIESVLIKKHFSRDGVELRVLIKEREPFITVVKEKEFVFLDSNGVPFKNPYLLPKEPFLYTYDFELVKRNFSRLKFLVESIGVAMEPREIYITELNTLLYSHDGVRVILPSLFMLEKDTIESLAKVYHNISMTDIKEIEVYNDKTVIMRNGVER